MTRIFLGLMALVGLAAAPAWAVSEIGTNDFRISDMGTDGDPNFEATIPDVAYNSADNQYLVVWVGDDTVNSEFEIYGRIIDAATGSVLGGDFRISHMGPDGATTYRARPPAVAYNSADNQYLVVWAGDDDTAPLVDGEDEIFGRRVNADGSLVGADHFRISDMGPNGDVDYDADHPAIAYNATDNQYLVVWIGDDDAGPLVDEEEEVFGQRLNADGILVGSNDFRISDMGPNGDTAYAAIVAAVAYNSQHNEYLVVWEGDDNLVPLVDEELEIFGQRINAATGAALGTNDFRISEVGPLGDPEFKTFEPSIAYNPDADEYLVVWYGDDDTAPLVDNEDEIFGSRLDAAGVPIGSNHFRISDAGPDGDTLYGAFFPDVTYDADAHEYLVVWLADDGLPLGVNESEIFAQRIDGATGDEVGLNDVRISDMGPDGSSTYAAGHPAVAYSTVSGQYLVVWEGDDDTSPLVDGEFEIFGQRLVVPGCGNGVVESGEECDDGNVTDGDGCDSACQTEEAGTTGGTTGSGTSGDDSGGGCSLIR
jgi:cysteine-rich repeat protein